MSSKPKAKQDHVNLSNIDAKLFLMGDAKNLGKTPTGILALLVPMRTELSVKQKLTLANRQHKMRALFEADKEELREQLNNINKSVHWKHDCSNPICLY